MSVPIITPGVFIVDDVSYVNIVLPSFSFSIDASNAVFTTYNPLISQGVNVRIYASASTLNNAFQIFTEDVDLLQNDAKHDLQFRYVDQSGNYGTYVDQSGNSKSYPNLFDTFANSIADTNPVTINPSISYTPPAQSLLDPLADRKTMGDEYINYIAYALFNNTQGLDILSNIKPVSDDLNSKADAAIINDRLYPLTFSGDNGDNIYIGTRQISDTSHPAQVLLTQIEYLQPQRLQNLIPVGGAGNENWYKNFLHEGDILSFDITVFVPVGQNLTQNQSPNNMSLSANTGNTTASGIDSRLYTVNVFLTA